MRMADYKKVAEFLSRLKPSYSDEMEGDDYFIAPRDYDDYVEDPLGIPAEGKILEALETLFVRDFLSDKEWQGFKKEVSTLHAFAGCGEWRQNGKRDLPDGYARHGGCVATDHWNLIGPGDGYAYDLQSIWYNDFCMSEDCGVFICALDALRELQDAHSGNVESLMKYFNEGTWKEEVLCADPYMDFDGEYDMEDDGEIAPGKFMATAFYLYHLSVAPIPDAIMQEAWRQGVDFSVCNRGAAEFLDFFSPVGMPSWFNEDGPASPTTLERAMLSVAFGFVAGYDGTTGWFWKSDEFARYLDERKLFDPSDRAVTDALFSAATCGMDAENVTDEAATERYGSSRAVFWHAVCGVQDGDFYFTVALPPNTLPAHALRLAFTAFRGAYALAKENVNNKEKEGAA